MLTFASSEEFWARGVDLSAPSCILLEMRLPGVSGLGFQARLNRSDLAVPIVFHTDVDNPELVVQAIQGGSVDYLCKPARPERITAAVERAFDLSVKWHDTRLADQQFHSRIADLTHQGLKVYQLLLQGKNSKEIAAELDIGIPSVAKHRIKVLQKLGVRNTVELVTQAIERFRSFANAVEFRPGRSMVYEPFTRAEPAA